MHHMNETPREEIQQPDPRFTLSVSQISSGWVYHLNFVDLPRKGGLLKYEQCSGQSREFAIKQGLAEAQRLIAMHRLDLVSRTWSA